ncbi:hypothetical protein K456DRAFT_1099610 [Colletotrichum gloeosporioides 23]|nr:hypothetical protein K456DRAFT_1099610 [Colletotrichum gloeosporioides 23]
MTNGQFLRNLPPKPSLFVCLSFWGSGDGSGRLAILTLTEDQSLPARELNLASTVDPRFTPEMACWCINLGSSQFSSGMSNLW